MHGASNGVTIGDKHTYRDFGLILKSQIKIEPAEVKLIEVDIPGADGSLDLTTALNGYEVYYNRTITMPFNIKLLDKKLYYRKYSELANYLHGRKFKIIIDDDVSYYWYGRISLSDMDMSYNVGVLNITANVEPYKMEVTSTSEDWLWDPFDFEQGIIREYFDLQVDGELEVTVIGSRKPTIPSIKVSADMILEYEGVQYPLEEGTNKVVNVELLDNEYTLKFIGTGEVTIDYRGGSL